MNHATGKSIVSGKNMLASFDEQPKIYGDNGPVDDLNYSPSMPSPPEKKMSSSPPEHGKFTTMVHHTAAKPSLIKSISQSEAAFYRNSS